MQNAGDLAESITMHSKIDAPIDVRAAANRHNAQAVLALVQAAVTIHAASKTARNGR